MYNLHLTGVLHHPPVDLELEEPSCCRCDDWQFTTSRQQFAVGLQWRLLCESQLRIAARILDIPIDKSHRARHESLHDLLHRREVWDSKGQLNQLHPSLREHNLVVPHSLLQPHVRLRRDNRRDISFQFHRVAIFRFLLRVLSE